MATENAQATTTSSFEKLNRCFCKTEMLGALAAAGTAFYEALPNHVPLKYEIRAQLEREIPLSEVVQQKESMWKIVDSDRKGETSFDMVYDDHSKRCNDKQLEASLDRVDVRFLPDCVGWFIAFVSFLIALPNGSHALSCTLESRKWMESIGFMGAVCRILVPLAITIAMIVLLCERKDRAKAYETELRKRIILDQIKK